MLDNEKALELLTLDEFANYMSLSKSAAYGMLQRGEVKAIKMGRIWRVPKCSIESYILSSLKSTTERSAYGCKDNLANS